ncbi:UDP-glucose 4-epimerase GalE [Phenylobacterium sp.]|uniref:UDP-glucose 4-epimerase GalE n=1 Tax=Phenylobacterium sp. TaxID=1871053 RepID=UPI003983B8A9
MAGVLITGGAGYIGSCFAWACRDADVPFAILDDLTTGHRHAPPDAPFVQAKVSDRNAVEGLVRDHGLDAIVHFAASISVEESVRDPDKYFRNNVEESAALLDTAQALGVNRFVFSSTAAVYGDTGDDPVPETHPLAPISPYGESKARVEAMLRDRSQAGGPRYAALRYFNVAGADPKLRTGLRAENATHLFKVCCEAALGQRDQVAVYGDDYATRDGTCIRDYIHVADLVDAHLQALGYLAGGGQSLILNCGYGRGYTVREVLDAFERVLGRPLPAVQAPRRAGDAAQVVADSTRLRTALGWKPRHDDVDAIVRSALDWEKRAR